MKKSKLLANIAMGAVIVSTLTGCTSETTQESNKQETNIDGKTVLKVWGMGEEGRLLSKMEEEFESENPDIDIQVQALPWDSAHDKLLMAVASGDGPDVVQMGTSWIPEFADAGALMDLTPYIEAYPNIDPSNYFESSLETTRYDDVYVSVPWYVDTRVLYYRKDLLEGVGYPEGPSTWDELKDAATQLAARGEGLYGMDLDPKDQFFAVTYGWQNGSEIIKDGQPQFRQPEFTEAVSFINSFFTEGLTPLQDDMDIIQAFKEGIKPMFVSGPWMINMINDQAPEIAGQWAVRTLPAKKTNTSFVGGANFTVFNSTKNADAAMKFISYMTEVDTQMEWLTVAGALPSRTEAWEREELAEHEHLSVFGEQMTSAKPAPFLVQWEAIAQEVIATMERINVGGADIQSELEALDNTALELLQ